MGPSMFFYVFLLALLFSTFKKTFFSFLYKLKTPNCFHILPFLNIVSQKMYRFKQRFQTWFVFFFPFRKKSEQRGHYINFSFLFLYSLEKGIMMSF